MFKKHSKRWLGLLLALSILLSGNASILATAAEAVPADTNEISFIEESARQNFAVPSDSKHAYDPFAQLETEEATKEYRESVEIAEDTIIYKQIEKTGLFRQTLKPETEAAELEEIGISVDEAEELNRKKVDDGLFSDTYEITYEAPLDSDVWDAVDALSETEGVVDAQPDYVYRTTAIGVPDTTTDPDFDRQWYLSELHTQDIWQEYAELGITPGMETIVAVIDTGVDYTHPDLIPSMWVNTAELNGTPGVDDDGNGYVDDIYGASTVGASYYHTGDPMDDHGHGTHVAGIIAMAAGNREGGVGVAYGAKIMAIKAGYGEGFNSTDVAEAIRYAVANGADIINMSFGGGGREFLTEEALQDAFGSCVLVASAGNDNTPTNDTGMGVDIYPAALPYVLGVMASDQAGNLATFSNWDILPRKGADYDLVAPGVDIFSTLPGGQYAFWSGTSMAAPIVSAAAAILRTKYFDKNLYSSRFIMGQLAGGTKSSIQYSDDFIDSVSLSYPALNIIDSLNNTPVPDISLKSAFIFDGKDISANNDNDGIVDAGEIIDIGFVLRNHWGLATDVIINVDAKSTGGVENPNIQFITDTIQLNDIGTFSEQNNSLRYDGDYLEGTDNPIRLSINSDATNDAPITLNIHITARNGLDQDDAITYRFDSTITFRIQRGRELRGVIDQDTLLTNDYFWIIPSTVLVPEGVTLSIEEGTQVQFGTSVTDGAYGESFSPFQAMIQVEGNLIVKGTEENPVELFNVHEQASVNIHGKEKYEVGDENIVLEYCKINNPGITLTKGRHLYFTQTYPYSSVATLFGKQITDSIFSYMTYLSLDIDMVKNCSFDSCSMTSFGNADYNSNIYVYQNNSIYGGRNQYIFELTNLISRDAYQQNGFKAHSALNNNAILNPILKQNSGWLRVVPAFKDNALVGNAINNYWGTTDERLIELQITDFNDNVSYADIIHTPWLTLESPELEDIYPFVTKAYVTDLEGNPLEIVGFQTVQIHVEFNRDMDPDIQPMVSYGPAEPYTDYVVSGDWVDARHWVGETSIKPTIDSGTEYIRVKGGAAADDNWLVTGTDWGRFAFTISNTGVQAMNLQAEGLENRVRLSWTQTDYDTLAGYNVYRADSAEGPFTKLNTTVIPGTIREYVDTDVEAGEDYYYYFTVVGTDMSESEPSNTAVGTPVDNIRPVLEHTRVTQGKYGEALSFSATATDNVGVEYVKVFYRAKGTDSWSTLNLSAGENNRYFGVIPAGEVSRDGMEYYIEVSDGTSVARDGSSQAPISIAIDSTAVIYSVSPSYVDTAEVAEGITGVLTGVNFTEDMVLTVGGKEVEYTFDSGKQLTFQIPANSIGRVDIALKRGSETAAILTNAITYEDTQSEVQILGGNVKARESVRLPVMVTAGGDLFGVELRFKVNRDFFSAVSFEKSEEASSAIADYNMDSAGNITVTVASATALPKDTAIGYLVLTAKDLSNTTSTPIQLTYASLNNVDAASLVDCNVTVEPNFTIGGQITYYKDGSPMAGVTVRLSNGMTTVTGEDGRYTFTGVTTGNVRVTPEFHGSANDAVTAYDASLVLQAIVGKTELTEEQQFAANVDGDAELSTMDAVYILQKSVGMIDGTYPGSGMEWAFDPAGESVSLTGDNTGLDFTAYLLGDVNGDWKAIE